MERAELNLGATIVGEAEVWSRETCPQFILLGVDIGGHEADGVGAERACRACEEGVGSTFGYRPCVVGVGYILDYESFTQLEGVGEEGVLGEDCRDIVGRRSFAGSGVGELLSDGWVWRLIDDVRLDHVYRLPIGRDVEGDGV